MLDMNSKTGRVGAMNKLDNDYLDLKLANRAVELARGELALAMHSEFDSEIQRQEQLQKAFAQVRLAAKHLDDVMERHPEPKSRRPT